VTEDDGLFPAPINLLKAREPRANHTLQRTGGTVAVPTVWGPRGWIVSSSPAAERGAFSRTLRVRENAAARP